ncbi:MAG: acetyl-CoA carboxylase carboxyltransferase subunit beta [Candidatus Eisenbacteria sp.]|nr:acetyl-CoA carboxylase carboxyltransferase subunit beta [Candidatus Eisenbacteria bacterium]
MSWLKKIISLPRPQQRRQMPDGVWLKCPRCGEILFRQELERNLWVCSRCSKHLRLSPEQYVRILCDEGSFATLFGGIRSSDPLRFRDAREKYSDKVKRAQRGDPEREGVMTGRARIAGIPLALAVMDFSFMGGSMGSVVGERIAKLIQLALQERMALIIISCSGGARMHEGIYSLMQMAKTCAQLARFQAARLPFISVLTDPTTGGVSASFAMLGDVIVAEPGALIGFAGPRVIRETIGQELPSGFQRTEFLLEKGFIDQIVPRHQLREALALLLKHFSDSARCTRVSQSVPPREPRMHGQ